MKFEQLLQIYGLLPCIYWNFFLYRERNKSVNDWRVDRSGLVRSVKKGKKAIRSHNTAVRK